MSMYTFLTDALLEYSSVTDLLAWLSMYTFLTDALCIRIFLGNRLLAWLSMYTFLTDALCIRIFLGDRSVSLVVNVYFSYGRTVRIFLGNRELAGDTLLAWLSMYTFFLQTHCVLEYSSVTES